MVFVSLSNANFRATRARAGSFTGRKICQLYPVFRKNLRARLRRAVVLPLAPHISCMVRFKPARRLSAQARRRRAGGSLRGVLAASPLAHFAKAF